MPALYHVPFTMSSANKQLPEVNTVSFPAISEGIVSLFCLGEDALGVTIRGLQYPLEDGTLTHSHPLGVSNHFVGEPVSVRVAKGELLMLYPTRAGFPKREGHHG